MKLRRRPGLGETFDPSSDGVAIALNPDAVWESALESVAPGTTAIVQQQAAPGENWYDTLARSLPILAATYQQKQILDVQVDRARKGLPPLNASQFAAGVQIGLTPDIQKLLVYGAIGIGAAIFLARR